MRLFLALLLAVAVGPGPSAHAQELIQNGGFDRDLSGWTASGNPYSGFVFWPYWAAEDALGNSQSGSAVTPTICSFTGCSSTGLFQCVPVTSDRAYRLSLYEWGLDGGFSGVWYSSTDCRGGQLPASVHRAVGNAQWAQSAFLMSAPSSARSLSFSVGGSRTAAWDYVSLQQAGPLSGTSKVALILTAANAEGLFGAVFKTRVTLLSLAAEPFSVHLQVLPAAGASGPSRTVTLSPASTTSFEDLLGTFGYRGGAGIAVTYPIDQSLLITAEVYADSPDGRYTTVIPVLTDPLNDRRVVTPGIRRSSSSRTNIGCTSLDPETRGASAEFHAADGARLDTLWLVVPAYGWAQTSVPFDVLDGYILWTFDGALQCFAVNTDNGTNDGSLIR